MIETRNGPRGDRYRAKFNVRNNTFTSPWMTTRAEAEKWESVKRNEISDGIENTGAEMSFKAFAALWLEKHSFARKVHASAIRDQVALENWILPTLGGRRLRTIKTIDLEFLFSDISRSGRLSPKTINNYLGTVKKCLGDAVKWRYLAFSPAAPLERFKVQQEEVTIFSQDEVASVLAYTELERPEIHDLFLFALNTGCRLGECLALQWRSVDLGSATAKIEKTWDEREGGVVHRTKGKRFRTIPINEDALVLLRRLAAHPRRQESETVFSHVRYSWVTNKGFRRVMQHAGIGDAVQRGAKFHCCRHTFASEFMRQGGDLWDLQQILGHASITQTEKYAHFAPNAVAGKSDRVKFSTPKRDFLRLAKPAKA